MRPSEERLQVSEQDDFLRVSTCSVAISFGDSGKAYSFADYDDVINVDLGSRSVDDLARDCLSWYKCSKNTLRDSVHDDVDMLW
jgi:hypothetical protein